MRPVACTLVPRFVGALTIALGTSLPSLAASGGDVSLAFATPANLQIPNARLVLTPAEAGRLADGGWYRSRRPIHAWPLVRSSCCRMHRRS